MSITLLPWPPAATASAQLFPHREENGRKWRKDKAEFPGCTLILCWRFLEGVNQIARVLMMPSGKKPAKTERKRREATSVKVFMGPKGLSNSSYLPRSVQPRDMAMSTAQQQKQAPRVPLRAPSLPSFQQDGPSFTLCSSQGLHL